MTLITGDLLWTATGDVHEHVKAFMGVSAPLSHSLRQIRVIVKHRVIIWITVEVPAQAAEITGKDPRHLDSQDVRVVRHNNAKVCLDTL